MNAGFLVGHSALRRVVMGEARGEPATDEQIARMVQLLHESLAAGGLGFSSSNAPTHNDANGHPVPSRAATRDELVALAGAVRDHPGTTLEFIPTIGAFAEEHMDLMASMSLAANRPLNWNVLGVNPQNPDGHRQQLSASDYAADRGAPGGGAHRARPHALPPQPAQRASSSTPSPAGGRRWRCRRPRR